MSAFPGEDAGWKSASLLGAFQAFLTTRPAVGWMSGGRESFPQTSPVPCSWIQSWL